VLPVTTVTVHRNEQQPGSQTSVRTTSPVLVGRTTKTRAVSTAVRGRQRRFESVSGSSEDGETGGGIYVVHGGALADKLKGRFIYK